MIASLKWKRLSEMLIHIGYLKAVVDSGISSGELELKELKQLLAAQREVLTNLSSEYGENLVKLWNLEGVKTYEC